MSETWRSQNIEGSPISLRVLRFLLQSVNDYADNDGVRYRHGLVRR